MHTIENAREVLDHHWPPTGSIRDLQALLCAMTGCTEREASILMAERAAADRLALWGLDPASAREVSDAVLGR